MTQKNREKQIYKVTIIGSISNAGLVVMKFIAGILGNSSAMIADAIHSLSDFATDVIVLFFVRLSSKPKDKDHSYGHGKYETMATALIGFILLLVGAGLFWEGFQQIYNSFRGIPIKQPEMIALYAAIASIIIKEILYQYTRKIGKKVKSELVIANAWHHRSDAFSSIGTTVGIGGAILLGNKWVILDPIAAVIVSCFIMKIAIQIMSPSMNDLLEKSLPNDIQDDILTIISSVDGIYDPHNLRTRRIGTDFAIEVHVRVIPTMSIKEGHTLACEVEKRLKHKYGTNTHIAVHMEPMSDSICHKTF